MHRRGRKILDSEKKTSARAAGEAPIREPTTLELLVLASIAGAGMNTLYALHRGLQLSYGAVTPLVRRLEENAWIALQVGGEGAKKEISILTKGHAVLQRWWRTKMEDVPPDFPTILRRAWLAVLMGEPSTGVEYLRQSAAHLYTSTRGPAPAGERRLDLKTGYSVLKRKVDSEVSRTQASALLEIADWLADEENLPPSAS